MVPRRLSIDPSMDGGGPRTSTGCEGAAVRAMRRGTTVASREAGADLEASFELSLEAKRFRKPALSPDPQGQLVLVLWWSACAHHSQTDPADPVTIEAFRAVLPIIRDRFPEATAAIETRESTVVGPGWRSCSCFGAGLELANSGAAGASLQLNVVVGREKGPWSSPKSS